MAIWPLFRLFQQGASGRHADLYEQLAAIHKVQAVIEFDLQGHVLTAEDNFLEVVGYRLDGIRGRHHSIFVDPPRASVADVRELLAQAG